LFFLCGSFLCGPPWWIFKTVTTEYTEEDTEEREASFLLSVR